MYYSQLHSELQKRAIDWTPRRMYYSRLFSEVQKRAIDWTPRRMYYSQLLSKRKRNRLDTRKDVLQSALIRDSEREL